LPEKSFRTSFGYAAGCEARLCRAVRGSHSVVGFAPGSAFGRSVRA
jgi:hypothetical protein